MEIDVRHITTPHAEFSGEESAEVFDLEGDKFVRPASGLRYELTVDVLGTEVLVAGSIGADFEYLCSRCGEFYSTNLHISDFVRSYELEDGLEIIDVNPDMREEIVLNLPTYPACERGDACPNFIRLQQIQDAKSEDDRDEDHRWGALDDFKLD